MSSYRELRVWNEAMDFAVSVYAATAKFPKHEFFAGLAGQLRRAAISIPSNIAEGKGHRTHRECLNFLAHARGSLCEAETQIELACRLSYISNEQAVALQASATRIAKGVAGLMNFMRSTGPEKAT
ncbi:MAG: four helix bundle protein [Acidobacteria bacterium]|nr:four helix bundle protein [Acidobacteriota bacterium]